MATYVLGDLQGCYRTLLALLARVGWGPGRDRVWLAGDVVNRGPRSLECLRWARAHAEHVVLGNHDLHLLAVAAGVREARGDDTLAEILAAPDRAELIDWLRARPLLVEAQGVLLVHAGLLPGWSKARAARYAREAEAALRGPDWVCFLERLYRKGERKRDPLLAAVRAMTMVRVVDERGQPLWKFKGHPRDRPRGSQPWFRASGRAWRGRVLFGHWAALGLCMEDQAVGLDAGCVWGGSLAALRLEDGATFTAPNSEAGHGEMQA